MDQAATTSKARNHGVWRHRRWRGGKWRTFAAGGAPRGAPRVQGRPHHARLPVSARSQRAAAATPSGHEPSPTRDPADSSCSLGVHRAACRDHSRTHAATVHPGLEAHPTSATVPTRAHGRPHHARLPVSARSRRAAAATPSGHEPSPAPTPADSSCTLGDPHAACRDHSRTHPATVHPGLEARPTSAMLPTRAHGRPHHARLPVSARSRLAAAAAPSGHEPSPAPASADSSCPLGIHRAAGRDHSRTHAATVHPGLEAHPTSATLPTRAHGRPHHARLPVSARSRRAAAATPSGHEPSLAPAPADSSRAIGNPHAACRDHSRGHPTHPRKHETGPTRRPTPWKSVEGVLLTPVSY